MSPFEFLSVALSFVLGLAVTYLLSSLLSVFRERRTCRPDWLPLLWAGYIFAWQVQYWWVIYPLRVAETWTFSGFCLLFLLTIILFAAGGLVLPQNAREHEEGLRIYFEKDGRWGVLVMSLYFLLAPLVNARFFDAPVTHPRNLAIMGVGVFGLFFPALRSRRAQVMHTLVWGGLAAYLFHWMNPEL